MSWIKAAENYPDQNLDEKKKPWRLVRYDDEIFPARFKKRFIVDFMGRTLPRSEVEYFDTAIAEQQIKNLTIANEGMIKILHEVLAVTKK